MFELVKFSFTSFVIWISALSFPNELAERSVGFTFYDSFLKFARVRTHDRDNYESEEAYWADLPGMLDPERPQRTAAIAKRVRRDGFLSDGPGMKHVKARKATDQELLLVCKRTRAIRGRTGQGSNAIHFTPCRCTHRNSWRRWG